jgi:hypothetical protein
MKTFRNHLALLHKLFEVSIASAGITPPAGLPTALGPVAPSPP